MDSVALHVHVPAHLLDPAGQWSAPLQIRAVHDDDGPAHLETRGYVDEEKQQLALAVAQLQAELASRETQADSYRATIEVLQETLARSAKG